MTWRVLLIEGKVKTRPFDMESQELLTQSKSGKSSLLKPLRLSADEHELIALFHRAMQRPEFRVTFAELSVRYLAESINPDPIIPMQVVAKLLSMNIHRVHHWVHRLRIPQRYRLVGSKHRRHRMLYASELRMIHKASLRGEVRSYRELHSDVQQESI